MLEVFVGTKGIICETPKEVANFIIMIHRNTEESMSQLLQKVNMNNVSLEIALDIYAACMRYTDDERILRVENFTKIDFHGNLIEEYGFC